MRINAILMMSVSLSSNKQAQRWQQRPPGLVDLCAAGLFRAFHEWPRLAAPSEIDHQ